MLELYFRNHLEHFRSTTVLRYSAIRPYRTYDMAIAGNAGKDRLKKRWNEVVKDNLKKCGLGKTGRDGRLKLWGKRPTCASTDKGRKTKREKESVQSR